MFTYPSSFSGFFSFILHNFNVHLFFILHIASIYFWLFALFLSNILLWAGNSPPFLSVLFLLAWWKHVTLPEERTFILSKRDMICTFYGVFKKVFLLHWISNQYFKHLFFYNLISWLYWIKNNCICNNRHEKALAKGVGKLTKRIFLHLFAHIYCNLSIPWSFRSGTMPHWADTSCKHTLK